MTTEDQLDQLLDIFLSAKQHFAIYYCVVGKYVVEFASKLLCIA
jgi:hypothetical protein